MNALTSAEVRLLVGMRRTGKITQTEFLQGIWIARKSESRSKAEREAGGWFASEGRFTKYIREYTLAVGHLAKHRLQMDVASFSSVFVSLLMEACVTVEEAKRASLAFSILDCKAGARELVHLYQAGQISRRDVEAAVEAAVDAESLAEAGRLAQHYTEIILKLELR